MRMLGPSWWPQTWMPLWLHFFLSLSLFDGCYSFVAIVQVWCSVVQFTTRQFSSPNPGDWFHSARDERAELHHAQLSLQPCVVQLSFPQLGTNPQNLQTI